MSKELRGRVPRIRETGEVVVTVRMPALTHARLIAERGFRRKSLNTLILDCLNAQLLEGNANAESNEQPDQSGDPSSKP
jgi:hypothetical protein